MQRALPLIAAALLLAACSQKAEEASTATAGLAAYAPTDSQKYARAFLADKIAEEGADSTADKAALETLVGGKPASPQINVPAGMARLAYSYHYAMETRAGAIAGLMARHETACKAAGPQVCQITGSSVSQDGGRISGVLHMRAEPGWLTHFRDGLAGEAKAAGGRLTRNETETEDLSTQIVDTEASLKAMTTLRDRLQALLASRPGKLEELLQVEQSLADTQGQIDAAASRLAMMRQRVDTSTITIDYESKGVLSEQGAWRPVTDAIRGSQGVMAATIGFVILLVSVLIPLSVVGAGVWWAVRRALRWRKAKKGVVSTESSKAAPKAK